MRLIDTDTLVKDLSYLYTKNHIPVDMRARKVLTTIMEQPTAYDVDNVLKQLEDEKSHMSLFDDELEEIYKYAIDDAIEIVKASGMNNNSKNK